MTSKVAKLPLQLEHALVGPVAAKHPYKKRCSEGGRGGWQGGWRGSPIIGATLGAQKILSP